jgi:pantoate--beta-alanine ligase
LKVLRTPEEMHAASRVVRQQNKRIGLVPTMGALHEGHLSLVRAARSACDWLVVTIFVNPLQFGPNEDFERYPRPFERDCQLLEAEKVDAVFAPSREVMYPADATTFVEVAGLADRLDGHSRPGHFRGVATVVAKLFNIVQPDLAFFGQKDAAQVAVIRRLVRDLNFEVEVRVCPIVREADGVAMSSRNAYLDPQQRKTAAVLYRALARVQTMADSGERDAKKLAALGRSVMVEEPAVRLDYFEVVNPDTLEPVGDISKGGLVAAAAYVGATRLIDNVMLLGVGSASGQH